MSARTRPRAGSAGLLLAVLALAVPATVLAADFTVTAIPGGGWIQAPDNNAGDAVIVAGPAGGLGTGSVELTSIASTPTSSGSAVPLVATLADLAGGSLDDLRHR